jgi:thiamine pyrophosphokinase
MITWRPSFLYPSLPASPVHHVKRALIILNQPFSASLLQRLWEACQWRCCADGGANRLYDILVTPSGDATIELRSMRVF